MHGYNTKWADGHDHQGGYSTHIRAEELFVFPIPESIPSVEAASMLCGGLTSFSPLVRNNVGPGSKVGVVGLGGLGHYAVLFGAALGAEVTVFSRSDAKKADALAMGAKRFVATVPGFEKDLFREFDLIVCAASSNQLPIDALLSTLDVEKKFVFVGMPDEGLSNIRSQTLAGNGAALASSHIGSKCEVIRMLDLAVEKKVKPWINVIPMKDAAEAIKAVENGTVRYRTILTQVSVPEGRARSALPERDGTRTTADNHPGHRARCLGAEKEKPLLAEMMHHVFVWAGCVGGACRRSSIECISLIVEAVLHGRVERSGRRHHRARATHPCRHQPNSARHSNRFHQHGAAHKQTLNHQPHHTHHTRPRLTHALNTKLAQGTHRRV